MKKPNIPSPLLGAPAPELIALFPFTKDTIHRSILYSIVNHRFDDPDIAAWFKEEGRGGQVTFAGPIVVGEGFKTYFDLCYADKRQSLRFGINDDMLAKMLVAFIREDHTWPTIIADVNELYGNGGWNLDYYLGCKGEKPRHGAEIDELLLALYARKKTKEEIDGAKKRQDSDS